MMELETHEQSSRPAFRPSRRQRSVRRLRHEAQIQVFAKTHGDLEQIRQSLSLRPSQMAELLRVHPSAWTRWVKTGQAPPHIYRMLEWYLELQSWRSQTVPEIMNSKLQPAPEVRDWPFILTQLLLAVGVLGLLIKLSF